MVVGQKFITFYYVFGSISLFADNPNRIQTALNTILISADGFLICLMNVTSPFPIAPRAFLASSTTGIANARAASHSVFIALASSAVT